MKEFSANGKCCVCGRGFAKSYKIGCFWDMRVRLHPWCRAAMRSGRKQPVAFWRSIMTKEKQ